MIVYISTERNSGLFEHADMFSKTYIKWQYDVGRFVKEEYANILSIHPDAIVIDYRAFKNVSKLTLMKDAFPNVKFVVTVDEETANTLAPMEGFDIIILNNDSLDRILDIIYPERKKDSNVRETKIGIISEEKGAEVNVAFNLLEFLSGYTRDVCYIEAAEKSRIPKYEKKFGLAKREGFYEYKGIPILFNMGKSGVKISVFSFDAGNRKMFEQCDYPLELKDGKLIFNQNSYDYPKFKNPVRDDRSDVYRKIFGNKLGFEIKETAEETELEFSETDETKKKIRDKEKIGILIKCGILIFILSILIPIIFFTWSKSSKVRNKSITKKSVRKTETVQEILTTQEGVAVTWEETTIPEEITNQEETVTEKKKRITSKKEKKTTDRMTEAHTENVTKGSTYKEPVKTTVQKDDKDSETKKTAQKKKTVKKKVTAKKKKENASKKEEATTSQPFDFEYKID